MSIGEISSRLSGLVSQASYFEFLPFDESTFTSDTIDLAIRKTQQGFEIDICEPRCGIPNLDLVLLRDNKTLRKEIEMIWTASRKRKTYLFDVMTAVINQNSGNLQPNATVRMIKVAKACDLHVTTVSRILDDKICQLEDQVFTCRKYIYGLRSDEN